jgi:hypothetical protein
MPSTVKTNCKDEEKNIKIFLIKIYIYYLQHLYIYKKLAILKTVQMEISEFINRLGTIDLDSFIKVLKAYQEAFKEGFSQVENFGFNEELGFFFCCLNGNITIVSSFGQNVFYCPTDNEYRKFSSLEELVKYLKK